MHPPHVQCLDLPGDLFLEEINPIQIKLLLPLTQVGFEPTLLCIRSGAFTDYATEAAAGQNLTWHKSI